MKQTKNTVRAHLTGATTTTNDNRTTRRAWRTVTRDGLTVLRSPEGIDYRGAASEIRAARLYPWRRRNLAESIRLNRYLFRQGLYTRDELLEANAERRRQAVQDNAFDRSPNPHMEITEDMRVSIGAAARATGVDAIEYERRAIAEAIERTRREIGGELPYTRHEQRAIGNDGCVCGAGAAKLTFVQLDGESMKLLGKLQSVLGITRHEVIRLAIGTAAVSSGAAMV